MSAILTGLTKYVDEQRLPLISKLGLEAKSAKEFELMTGVKGDTALNLLEVDGFFQNGKACGWNDSGSTAFTQRVMKPANIKIQTSICQNAMLRTTVLRSSIIFLSKRKLLPSLLTT